MPNEHTPGPWAYDDSITGRLAINSESALIALIPPSGANAVENARLIAAAPELLAFAQSLVDAWKGEGMPYPYKIALDASAAIAKATGEAA